LLNLDVLLARQALPAALSGVYAVALVLNKIAYWLPQAVGVIALPRLADAANRRRVVRTALLVRRGPFRGECALYAQRAARR